MLRDHQFVPAQVSIPAGVKVELKVINEQQTPAEFESSSLHREQAVTPGSPASKSFFTCRRSLSSAA